MNNFYTLKGTRHECESDDFCVCSVCTRNCSNGGTCNNCCTCTNGSKQESEEISCFTAMRTMKLVSSVN